MKLEQLAAQLFTVRHHIKEPGSIASSMKKISKMGYKTVQVSGMGPIPETELMSILDGSKAMVIGENGKVQLIPADKK